MALRILHLEDNLLDAELIEANLCEGGVACQIQRIETRPEFVAATERNDFDIILADYSLPSFDGLAALEIAREKVPDTPFIIISGALGEELAIETLKSGATDYILKHRLERLVPSVLRAMREKAEREARRKAERERELLLEREQEARRKAEEASRLKDEFLATISHELRTPLNAIYGWASILRGGKLNPEDAANAVRIIERNAKVQIQLIEDLLDVSRMITGNLRLEIKQIDPAAIIKAAIDAVRPAADAKSIEIKTEFDSELKYIFADPNRLQQIVWNLLSNAVKFTPREGVVSISLNKNEDNVEINVKDTGEGIKPDFLPFVFDRFRQAEQATTRIHGGLGLGLAIVKNLVEMHGGSVAADSAGIGFGSTFTINLPQSVNENNGRVEFESLNAKQFSSGSTPLAGLKILAVEDDEDSRELLIVVLGQNGANVTTAITVLEAMNSISQNLPDILVSDVGLPGEDGYSLIKKIRAMQNGQNPKIPAIALTGFARPEDQERALASGFDAFVAKPIEPSALVEAILKIAQR
jgi:signal transduction histidine kinase